MPADPRSTSLRPPQASDGASFEGPRPQSTWQERVLRALADAGKPFAMLLPISILHVGWHGALERACLGKGAHIM